MLRSLLMAMATMALGLSACSRSDTSDRPAHSAVAAAMPDAASTPGATGPATAAPHAPPPPVATMSDNQSSPMSAAPATGGMAAAGSINDIDRATPNSQASGKANAAKSP